MDELKLNLKFCTYQNVCYVHIPLEAVVLNYLAGHDVYILLYRYNPAKIDNFIRALKWSICHSMWVSLSLISLL